METISNAEQTPLLELQHITKTFGGVCANDDISLVCYPGEVLSLLGENGAGKTTLMKVLYGMHQADSGRILWRGKEADIQKPIDAISLGIQMVHQHFMLIPTFTVAENIVLGCEPQRHGALQMQRAVQICSELSARYNLKIDGKRRVSELSVGEQQRVEILKALYRGAELLILDEPTAVLTPIETRELFETIAQLRKSGKSVIIITHKLKETKAISDRVYVLRSGRLTGERRTAETTIDELTKLMVGYHMPQMTNAHPAPGAELLCVEHMTLQDKLSRPLLSDISFTLSRGEILGIAGVEGNGQEPLIEILSGIRTDWTGELRLNGRLVKKPTPAKMIQNGVATIHADRQNRGLFLDKSATKNMTLGFQWASQFYHCPLLRWDLARKKAESEMEDFDVRPCEPKRPAGELSGGNQQKLVVAREFSRNADLIIAANPTRGIDIGAVHSIHERILQARDSGKAVLLISSDLDEILALSDRIAVIYEGRLVAMRSAGEFTEMELGNYMGGTSNETK